MEQLPYITFFDAEALDTFWQYMKAYLWIGAPLIMIVLALMSAEHLVDMIRNVFYSQNSKDDEDEEEIYYY